MIGAHDPNVAAWERVAAKIEAACVELDSWLPPLAFDIRRAVEERQEWQAHDHLVLAVDTLRGLAEEGYTCGRPSEHGSDDPETSADAAEHAADALVEHLHSDREPLEGDE